MTTKLLITALAAGLLIGIAFAGTDLLNPKTAVAEADQMDMNTQHQRALNELEERLSTAKTEAEIKGIERQQSLLDVQYQNDIQALNQRLAHKDMAFRTWMFIITMVGGALSLTLIIVATVWIVSKMWKNLRSTTVSSQPGDENTRPNKMSISNKSKQKYGGLWTDKNFRKERIAEARDNETMERLQKLNEEYEELALLRRLRSISNPTMVETGKYGKLPLGV